MHDLNPRIRTTAIGIKELRQVKIYPLSIADQTEVVELVTVLINSIAEQNLDGLSEVQIAEMFGSTIAHNIKTIIGFVTDPNDLVQLSEIDNSQLVEIIGHIVTVNFGDVVGELKALWNRAMQLFLSPK